MSEEGPFHKVTRQDHVHRAARADAGALEAAALACVDASGLPPQLIGEANVALRAMTTQRGT